MKRSEIKELSKAEQMDLFYKTANKVGLVKDYYYESGCPEGEDDDEDLFYLLEEMLNYPPPGKVSKKSLK